MHFTYRLYSLICTLHPAFCVLLLSLGFQPSVLSLIIHFPPISIEENNGCLLSFPILKNNSTNDDDNPHFLPYDVEIQPWILSSFYFLACISSSAFAMVYLFAMDENAVTGSADQSGSLDYAKGSDLLFWCFLFACTCLSIALPTRKPSPLDQIYLRCLLHFGALFWLCAPRERASHELSLSISLLILIASSFFTTLVACSQVALVLSLIHRFLDLLLVFTHRWETHPPQETLYNSRLFFIAMAGLLFHLDVILLPTPSISSV